jgi:hypothetical protein
MMHLLERHARPLQDNLDGGGMDRGYPGGGVQRFNQDSDASVGESRINEGSGIGDRQKTRLQPDTASEEVVAEFNDPGFALVGRHQLGKNAPRSDGRESSPGIGLDSRGSGQRDGNSGASRVDSPDRCVADLRSQGLATVRVVGVKVDRSSPRRHGANRRLGQSEGRLRHGGMVSTST